MSLSVKQTQSVSLGGLSFNVSKDYSGSSVQVLDVTIASGGNYNFPIYAENDSSGDIRLIALEIIDTDGNGSACEPKLVDGAGNTDVFAFAEAFNSDGSDLQAGTFIHPSPSIVSVYSSGSYITAANITNLNDGLAFRVTTSDTGIRFKLAILYNVTSADTIVSE